MTTKRTHTRAIQKIANRPGLIGLQNIIASSTEVKLFDSHGQLITEVDVVLYDSCGDFYIVEYKDNGDERLKKRAEQQLRRAVEWFSARRIAPKAMIIDGHKYPGLKEWPGKQRQYDTITVKRDLGRHF